MLVNFLKKSFAIQYTLLGVLIAILWSFTIFFPTEKIIFQDFPSPAYHLIGKLIISYPLLTVFFAFLLLLAQAVIFNQILIINDIISRNSVIGLFTYGIFMSFNISFNYLSPVLIANTIILIILYQIFMIYKNPEEYQLIFNIGFMVSLASLFYFPAIYLLIFIWITFIIFRMVKWREWIILFFGLIIPYLFFAVYLYWTDTFQMQISEYAFYFSNIFSINLKPEVGITEASIYVAGMLFIAFSVGHLILNFFEQAILLRRNLSAAIALFLVMMSIFIVHGGVSIIITVIPGSILVAFSLSKVKKTFIPDALIILFLLLIILNNFLVILS